MYCYGKDFNQDTDIRVLAQDFAHSMKVGQTEHQREAGMPKEVCIYARQGWLPPSIEEETQPVLHPYAGYDVYGK